MVRTISLIHERTVPKKTDEHLEKPFTIPAFSYTFPLLKYSLTSNYAKNHDELIHDGLQIITEHAKLRGKDSISGAVDLYHPRYLPTKQILILLCDIISEYFSTSILYFLKQI